MKKLLTFALAALFVCALGMSSIGCSKGDDKTKKDTPAPATDKKEKGT